MFGLFKKQPPVEPPIPPIPAAWPPPEIPEKGPRTVRFTTNTELGLWVLRAVSIFAIVIGIPAILHGADRTSRFAREGKVVQARVTDLTVSTGKSTTYRVSYFFEFEGTPIYDTERVSSGEYNSLTLASSVPVTVFPGDPYNHRYGHVTEADARQEQETNSLWVMALSGAAGIGALAYRAFARGQQTKLASWPARPAQVIHLKSESAGKSGQTYTLRYRLLMPNGSIEEFVHTQTSHEAPPAQLGNFFTAVLNPDNGLEAIPLWRLSAVEIAPEGWEKKSLKFFT